MNNVTRAPMSFHSNVDSGVTVNRFSEDLRLIDMELPTAAFGVATSMYLHTCSTVDPDALTKLRLRFYRIVSTVHHCGCHLEVSGRGTTGNRGVVLCHPALLPPHLAATASP